MPFNPFTIDLPVREIIPAVREHLSAQNTLIVNAPPGAGKSTLLPLGDHHILPEVDIQSTCRQTGNKAIA